MTHEEPFTPQWYESLPTKHVAAGCLFLDDDGRILLVKPTYKEPWEIPGGGVEANESPLEACRREIKEELGVDWSPTSFLGVDHRPRNAVRQDALRFVFAGRIRSDDVRSIRLARAELSEWRLVPPEELDAYVTPAMANRLRALLGGATYVEDGKVVLPGSDTNPRSRQR